LGVSSLARIPNVTVFNHHPSLIAREVFGVQAEMGGPRSRRNDETPNHPDPKEVRMTNSNRPGIKRGESDESAGHRVSSLLPPSPGFGDTSG